MQQMLRIGYAHVQWVMYRPFLHYISNDFQSQDIDRRSYGCATACISVSRNIIHITTEMYNRRLLNGSSWFAVHTIYYAVLTLAYFLLENPGPPATTDGILKDTLEGKNTLAGLANNSIAVERCACLYVRDLVTCCFAHILTILNSVSYRASSREVEQAQKPNHATNDCEKLLSARTSLQRERKRLYV